MIHKALIIVAAFLAFSVPSVSANDGTTGVIPDGYAATGEFEQCLKTYNVRDYDGQGDGRTLVVTMRNGDVYRSVMINRCPGLRQNRTISIRSDSRSELCSSDTIVVQSVGVTIRDAGLGGGHPCPLSDFERLEKVS